jgi:zinc transport system substrate-binding protein
VRGLIPVIVATIVLLVSGCAKNEAPGGRFKIVTSFYPVYIIAKNITEGVQGVELVNMTPPITGCLHDYSLTTGDMRHLEKASLFLVNGAGMESFLDTVAKRYPDLKRAELAKGIPLIGGDKPNPHVWVSVSNAMVMTRNCADALIEADPAHEREYRTNMEKYYAKLESLRDRMKKELAAYKGRKIVTFHEAFPYFAKEYDLEIAAVIEREPGSEPAARDVAETILIVRKSGIRALFAEPQYPEGAAKTIARETGARVFTLDPAVTGSDDPDAYIEIMNRNLTVLQEALR